ncbi:MAG: CDP-glucose 4,6-dehydratase [Gaiellaceae bacterium]
MNETAWNGRRVLVTGDTGFKGSWLSLWLSRLGADVSGLALEPPTTPSLHALVGAADAELVDVRDTARVAERVREADPEVIFHRAARALGRPAFADPVGTYEVNVLGTVNVLEAARSVPGVGAIVVVTSDKVYAPDPDGHPHAEDSTLGGVEPYSSSKAAAEVVAAAYRQSYFAEGAALATARAGNVIGGGDWAVDRVVPDVVRAVDRGEPVVLRHPGALRPWQHVLEPLHGYLLLAERLLDAPGTAAKTLNFGPDGTATVAELVERLSAGFGGKPGWRQDEAPVTVAETPALQLDASRAKAELGWRPVLDLDATLDWTADWYRAHAEGEQMRERTLAQIAAYEELL